MVVVDRRIPQKCHLIEIAELAEDVPTDAFRSDPLLVLRPFILERIHDVLHFFRRELSLHEGFLHGVHNLGAIVRLKFS